MNLLTLDVAPTDEVVTLAEARSHLRFYDPDDTSENDYVQSLIDTAVANIDGPEGMLGRALRPQSLTLTIDAFPIWKPGRPFATKIKIPLPPLVSVESVKYTAPDGTEATYSGYRVFGVGAARGGYIMPAITTSWPVTACDVGAVRIAFTAGYDPAATPPDTQALPPSIKHAALLIVSHLYEHREENLDTGAKFGMLELPFGVTRLLEPHRIR